MNRAVVLYTQAIERDPGFAEAYVASRSFSTVRERTDGYQSETPIQRPSRPSPGRSS